MHITVMIKRLGDFFNRIFGSTSYKREYRRQWDYYTISILVNEKTITGQIHRIRKKYHIHSITPPHITLHYPFTIKDGFSEDDVFRVSTHILSQYDSLTFSINEILWLHKNRKRSENIIAFGIDQSGDFGKILIGLIFALSPYIVATVPFERNPVYKIKARPHISIAYGLNYHTAELLNNELKKQQLAGSNNAIIHTYPILRITMKKKTGKHNSYFDFDFKEKCWKKSNNG